MPLYVENKGAGYIGDLGSGWRVSQNGSPMTLGDSPGRLGSLSFSAKADETTRFTIDDYVTVQHFYDNNIDRFLSTFDGYIRNLEIDQGFGQFSVTSILGALDVDRTSSARASGTYQRTFEIPSGTEYEILGTPYTVGGYWSSVGSENVFVRRPTIVWDMTASQNYVYVLADGSHDGQVVAVFGFDGILRNIWPVYSDATDLSGPMAKYIAYADSGHVFIGQVNADRVKKFDTNGNFVLQFGNAGTGDGQFNTISGLAVNNTAYNAVYVSDSVLGRVQYFDEYTGAFVGKFGSPGTGSGSHVFNQPNGLSIDPLTNNVLVSDANARVRAYTVNGGTMVATVMGKYNFSTSQSEGEFVAGNYYIDTTFDHLGNAYAIQLGKVYKYVRDTTAWPTGDPVPAQAWDTKGIGDLSQPSKITSHHRAGAIHVARSHDKIEQWAGSLGRINEYYLYYIALAAPDFPIRLLALNSLSTNAGEFVYKPWSGNVWSHLCQLSAATENAMVLTDDRLFLIPRSIRGFDLPDDVVVEPLSLDSNGSGRYVEIVNQNSRYTDVSAWEEMYSAEADNNRTFNVDINEVVNMVVNQDTYPEYLSQPMPATSVGRGKYVVIDKNGLVVTPSMWTNYGGRVKAEIGERPGDIKLTIIGPGLPIPGFIEPYKISTVGGRASLSVIGAGVMTAPEVLRIGTGIQENVNPRDVAVSIDSPFAHNAATAYTEGTWAAYRSGTPDQRVVFRIRPNYTFGYVNDEAGFRGTGTMLNTFVRYMDAEYIVEELDFNADEIVLTCTRYSRVGIVAGNQGIIGGAVGENVPPRFEEIWGGMSNASFEAFWQGYTAQDLTIAPYRNPFGV